MTEQPWRRSSLCADSTCPEVVVTADLARLRDSKRPEVVLEFSRDEWVEFVAGVKAGEFDPPERGVA